jgi:hypothetical protein
MKMQPQKTQNKSQSSQKNSESQRLQEKQEIAIHRRLSRVLKKRRRLIALLSVLLILLPTILYSVQRPEEVRADSFVKFDEGYGTTVNDNSGNISGTITNATWQTSDLCFDEMCIFFDGTGDYISFGDDADLDFAAATDWTIEFRFRTPDISSGTRTFVSKYKGDDVEGGYKVYMNSSGNVVFGVDDDNSWGPDDAATSIDAYDDNQWHHVATVKDGTTGIYLYVDGLRVDYDENIAATGTLVNDDDFLVGSGIDSGGSYENYYTGFFDELRVYSSTARSADEVKADVLGVTTTRGTSAAFGPDLSYLSDGLVGYWEMEDNVSGNGQTIADSSGNGNNGTTNDDASTLDCTDGQKYGLGCDFDGSDDWILVSDSSSLDVSSGLTISTWVNLDPTLAEYYMVGKNATAQKAYWFATRSASPDEFDLAVFDDGTTSYRVGSTNANLSADTWYHLVGTWNSGGIKLYKNGVELTTTVLSGSNPSSIFQGTSDLRIASGMLAGDAELDGTMDETRIYNRALSPSEILALYEWSPEPVGYWKLDESSDGTAAVTRNDSSGNGNNLTDSNTTNSAIGKYGNAADFEEDNTEALGIADGSQTGLDITGNISIGFWLKSESLDAGDGFVGKSANSNGWRSYIVQTAGGDSSRFDFGVSSDGDTMTYIRTNTGFLTTGTWVHLEVTYDGSTVRLYKNGIEQNSNNFPYSYSSGFFDTGAHFCIGTRSSTLPSCNQVPSDGIIDDVRVYNYARTGEQVIEDMNAGHPAPGSPIGSSTAEWKLDEGYGTTANDSSDNGLYLALSAASWENDGKFGKAYQGADNTRISLADDPDLDFNATSGITLSAWVRRDTISNDEYIIYKEDGDEGYTIYMDSSGDFIFGIGDTSSGGGSFPEESIGNVGTDYDDNEWHHVVAVKDGTDSIRLYVDTEEIHADTSLAVAATLENAGTFYLGDANGGDGTDEFLGDIDQVEIFHSALNQSQINALYNQGSGQVWGATSTDSSDIASWASVDEYCPPGQGSACTAPVAEWKMDENTGTGSNAVKDTSENANLGTMESSMTESDWVPGVYGSALDFDGSDDYIDAGNNSSLNDLSSFTWTLWMKSPNLTTSKALLSKPDNAGNNPSFLHLDTASSDELRVRVAQTTSATEYWTNNANLANDTWYFIAVTYQDTGTGRHKIYVNGDEKTYGATNDGSGTKSADSNNSFEIGKMKSGNYWNGLIDNARVYNYVRTPEQVAWEYNRGAPIADWKMDETAGNSCPGGEDTCDSSGNGTTYDGTGDYASCTDANCGGVDKLDFNYTEHFSVSAWFNTTDDLAAHFVSKKWSNSANAGYALTKSGDDKLRCYLSDASNQVVPGGTDTIHDGQWHHGVCVYNGTTDTAYLYLDGVLIDTKDTSSITATLDNTNDIRIGVSGSGSFDLDGKVDEARIYNYALTEQQVRDIYNIGTIYFGD